MTSIMIASNLIEAARASRSRRTRKFYEKRTSGEDLMAVYIVVRVFPRNPSASVIEHTDAGAHNVGIATT
jgi:hypothetical protein